MAWFALVGADQVTGLFGPMDRAKPGSEKAGGRVCKTNLERARRVGY